MGIIKHSNFYIMMSMNMMRQVRLDRHPLAEHVLQPLGPQAVFDRDGHVGEIDCLGNDQEAPPVSGVTHGSEDVPPDPPHQPASDRRGAESQSTGGFVIPLTNMSDLV